MPIRCFLRALDWRDAVRRCGSDRLEACPTGMPEACLQLAGGRRRRTTGDGSRLRIYHSCGWSSTFSRSCRVVILASCDEDRLGSARRSIHSAGKSTNMTLGSSERPDATYRFAEFFAGIGLMRMGLERTGDGANRLEACPTACRRHASN